jgi:hypothetical protein
MVGRELPEPAVRLGHIRPGVAGLEQVAVIGRCGRTGALQDGQGHGGRQCLDQLGSQSRFGCLELGQPRRQRGGQQPVQLGRGGRAVQVPLRPDQLQHQPLDHIAGEPGGDPGARMATIGRVVHPSPGPAHTVEDPKQAKVRTNPQDRVGILTLAGHLGGAELEGDAGHDGRGRRRCGGRFDAHTELAIESMMVP